MARETLGVQGIVIILILFMELSLGNGEAISGNIPDSNSEGKSIGRLKPKNLTPMHKVLMTQRGYIQFLRWELTVPEIEEFTFCLWVKSTNLTYPHSIFSYSKDEKYRLVRSWISSYGKSINLEINNVKIFTQTTFIKEHRWYHICESWDNRDGEFALWIDGQKQNDGYATKMAGHVIPSKGDIVLGQEYTDFDKGLEEGIEGAVLGFNFVLASAFDSTEQFFVRNKLEDSGFDRESVLPENEEKISMQNYGTRIYSDVTTRDNGFERTPAFGYTEPNFHSRRSIAPRIEVERMSRTKRKSNFVSNWRINSSGNTRPNEKPLGQQLVEISFAHCEQGRGSPRIGEKLMLISWTRTPVRVFGGAIVKNAKNECGEF